MPTFAYRAKDQAGRVVIGRVDAESEQFAVRQIREEGYWVTSIKHAPAVEPVGLAEALNRAIIKPLFFRVKLRDKMVMFRELATMVGAGMTLIRSLDILAENTRSGRLKQILREIQPSIETGRPLSDQLARYPTVFTEMEVALVRAGEHGGMLETMLRGIADYLEYEMELRRTISRETFYPKAVIVVGLLVLGVLSYVARTFLGPAGSATSFAGPLLTSLLVLLGAVSVGGLSVRVLLQRPGFAKVWDHIKLAIPLIGPNVKKLAVAKTSKALAALYSAGVTLAEAVGPSGRSSGNSVIAEAFERCAGELQSGGKLSAALAPQGIMPDMVLQMIRTGEETGDLDGMLSKVAEYYEDEAKTAIRQMCVAILPISIVLLGLLVLYIMVQFYLGYFGAILGGAG